MRSQHKHEILGTFGSVGIPRSQFKLDLKEDVLTITFKDEGKLFFVFEPHETDLNSYSYQYGRYDRKFSVYNHKNWTSFDETQNIFSYWLENHIKTYIADQGIDDPFEEQVEGDIFEAFEEHSEPKEEDNVRFEPDEIVIFENSILKLQAYLETKFNLQEEQVKQLKESVQTLIDGSKTETKAEVKKGVRKMLNDLFVKVLKDGLYEGGKYLLNFMQSTYSDLPNMIEKSNDLIT